MSFHEHKAILIHPVRGRVLSFKDSDGTACDAIYKTLQLNSNPNSYVIFCNGGDRSIKMTLNIPISDNTNVEFVFDVGSSVKEIVRHGYLATGQNKKHLDLGDITGFYMCRMGNLSLKQR